MHGRYGQSYQQQDREPLYNRLRPLRRATQQKNDAQHAASVQPLYGQQVKNAQRRIDRSEIQAWPVFKPCKANKRC